MMMTKPIIILRKTEMKYFSILLTILLTAVSIFINPADTFAVESVLKSNNSQPVAGRLVFATSPLKTMTKIPFKLNLANSNGNKLSVHSAACELTMPAMAMPENHPDLNCSGSSCTGSALFTMAGAWQVTFGIIMQDGTHASIVFDIDMVQLK